MEHTYGFEKLKVWQNARKFVVLVYQITENFPGHEKFRLVDQIRRAAVSISSNIAEGSSRLLAKDQAHFTNLAYSSLMEVLSHFYLAFDLQYIDINLLHEIKIRIFEISNQLNALRKAQIKNK